QWTPAASAGMVTHGADPRRGRARRHRSRAVDGRYRDIAPRATSIGLWLTAACIAAGLPGCQPASPHVARAAARAPLIAVEASDNAVHEVGLDGTPQGKFSKV